MSQNTVKSFCLYLIPANCREPPQITKSLTKLSPKGMRNSEKKNGERKCFSRFLFIYPAFECCVPGSPPPLFILHTLWYFHLQPIASASTYRLRIPKSKSQPGFFELLICTLESLPMSHGHLKKNLQHYKLIYKFSQPAPPPCGHIAYLSECNHLTRNLCHLDFLIFITSDTKFYQFSLLNTVDLILPN